MSVNVYQFRDLEKLTKAVVYLSIAGVVINLISLHTEYLQLDLLQRIQTNDLQSPVTDQEVDFQDLYYGLVGLFQSAIILSGVVFSCVWLYRASCNAFALTKTGMETTPAWAIGWWFIPFANLWKPYQAVREIWIASENPNGWYIGDRNAILPVWWFLWISSSSIDGFSARFNLNAEALPELITGVYAYMASDLVNIPLNIVFIYVVKGIWQAQLTGRAKSATEVFA